MNTVRLRLGGSLPLSRTAETVGKDSAMDTNSKVVVVTHIDLRRDFRDTAKLDVNLEVSTYSKEKPSTGEGSGAGSAAAVEKKG